MAKIISVHSFRGGTGKSNTSANIAALMASEGQRVCVVDTDIQSPGIHVLFGLDGEEINRSLNNFIWGKCSIEEAAYDVTDQLESDMSGRLFLVPSSINPGEITRVLREGYDAQMLIQGFRSLVEQLQLDVLIIDTHPGLGEETLLSMVVSHTLALILRPDKQDYEGTGVALQVARKLKVPNMMLVVNKVPAVFDSADVKNRVENAYDCSVAGVLPHSDDLMALASGGIFALRYPDHPLTGQYAQIATKLLA